MNEGRNESEKSIFLKFVVLFILTLFILLTLTFALNHVILLHDWKNHTNLLAMFQNRVVRDECLRYGND